jgi:hypothetical protein
MGFLNRNPVSCTPFMGRKGSTYEGSFATVVQLAAAVVCILLNNCIQRPTNLETGNSLSDEILHDNAVRCDRASPFNIFITKNKLNDKSCSFCYH